MGYLRGYRTPGGQRRFPVGELDEFVASLEERTAGDRALRAQRRRTDEDMRKDA